MLYVNTNNANQILINVEYSWNVTFSIAERLKDQNHFSSDPHPTPLLKTVLPAKFPITPSHWRVGNFTLPVYANWKIVHKNGKGQWDDLSKPV